MSTAWPKISVVTPSFNQGRFLEETIRSVLAQDYPNVEYIIIDGGSTDDSTRIIQQYSSRLTHWVSEPDRGQSNALNKGFAMATGDIVSWINSDDVYFSSDVFRRVAELFQAHSHVDACYGDNLYIDASGELLFCRRALPAFAKSLLKAWNFINQPTVFFRSYVLRTCRLNESYHFSMDYDLWLQMAERYTFAPANVLIAAARWHSDCKTIAGGSQDLQATKEVLRSRRLPVRHVRLTRKVAYFLLRLYSVGMVRDLGYAQERALFDLRIPGAGSVWTRQILGLAADRAVRRLGCLVVQ